MKTYFVDAFTNELFKGNPAAICLVEKQLNKQLMQDIAFEIGFSETAFIHPVLSNEYEIRFFTPKREIPLCGHATLAASKVIFETTANNTINFLNLEQTRLFVEKAGTQIKMSFPVYNTEVIAVPECMLDALGITQIISSVYNRELNIILIEIGDTQLLQKLKPNYTALIKSYTDINGVIITAKANEFEFDFHYRYFWPWTGTEEDPVTGGVQTFLTKYWAEKLAKKQLSAFQSSQRTGKMNTEWTNDEVCIYGEAVIVLEGNFKIN